MKNLIKSNLLVIIGVGIGAVAGYIYWYYWGCTEGCAITSKSLNMTAYGALMGGLTLSLFKKENKKQTNLENEEL